ncbi:MAG: aromatic ring-hydroxylating dioxygenase subunit alpha [Rhodobacteraceae bacterium]|nr:aromatic ring-hydroxylating dioxygenase subunit alpha [Paracoccaceae bacterium]
MAKDMDWDRRGLPARAYHDATIFALEQERLFRRHWQIVGHVSDLPEPGDYVTLDIAGERAVVIRGHDGVLRAFHNICRHRGTRVVSGETGRCNKAIVCPFHGWAYNFDGTLRGVAERQSFPPLDRRAWGLRPIELEVWQGFVFVRFEPSPQPPVARLMAPFEADFAPFDVPSMVRIPENDWQDRVPANWKSLRDVDNEGYHVRQAHPALHDLYGGGYTDSEWTGPVSRSDGVLNDGPGRLWSVRAYKALVGASPVAGLPQGRRWSYYNLFPNTVIGLYPDSAVWYQEIPLSPGETIQRGRAYRFREESRALRALRYLSGRIDRVTAAEDHDLCVWSYEATKSASGYAGMILSDLERGVRSFHDLWRREIPEGAD